MDEPGHRNEPVIVPFDQIGAAALHVDRVYAGGRAGTAADDAIARMFPVGNQGGFRFAGSPGKQTVRLIVLYTSGLDPDWPDTLDPETGDFTYYGDNKKPGSALHETPRRGNLLLRDIFAWSRLSPDYRARVPPILLFERHESRSVRFRGLLAPGSPRLSAEEELVAVWRTTRAHRFQNYRAHFTVLDTGTIETGAIAREWIDEVLAGDPLGPHCPGVWRRWVKGRIYAPLLAPRTLVVRTKAEQEPLPAQLPLLQAVHDHFRHDPVAFEHFAAAIWLHSDQRVEAVDVTRPSRDGGRDAVGTYLIGPDSDPIRISFALEAKCFQPGRGVGVRMVSRLISRIKHRDFGVFVTTSHVGQQAYSEVREDGHPVVFLTGRDIVQVMRQMGLGTVDAVREHLVANYPLEDPSADLPGVPDAPPRADPGPVQVETTLPTRTVVEVGDYGQ